jgi:hypothetical protein
MDPSYVLREIIDAHGGLTLWSSLDAIDAELSAWGLLFRVKRRPALDHVKVSAKVHEARFVFHEFPFSGSTAELIGNDEVRISRSDGTILERRLRPRSAFKDLRRLIYWDSLDFIYFGGYAMWNYLTAPFIFLRDGFHFEVLEPEADSSPSWTRLRVVFPDDIPTHSGTQTFYFDENWHLRRLDYTAEVVGRWARAAHFCEDYRDFGGIKAPTTRWVRPVLFGSRPLPGPILVALEIFEIRPVRKEN